MPDDMFNKVLVQRIAWSTTGVFVMSSIKRVIGLGFVTSAILASGLALASNHGGDHGDKGGKHAEKMQQRMDKGMSALKAQLAITAAQEGSWSDFQSAMKPPATGMKDKEAHSAKREAMKAMTTPERLDAQQAMKQQRDAQMKVRTDAIRSLYSQLTPAQQQTFDQVSFKMMDGKEGGKHGHDRGDSDHH